MTAMRTALSTLVAAAFLAACSVAEPPPSRPLTVPERYATAVPETMAPAPDPTWWHRFGSARLDELVARALDANADLAAATARIAAADARLRASGAAELPSVSGTFGAERTGTPFADGAKSQPANRFSAGLRASYELDLWGATSAGVAASRARAEASRHDRASVALSLASEVALAYIAILGFDERIDAVERSLALAREVQSLNDARERAGATSGLESAQQRAVIAAQEAQLSDLRRARAEQAASLSVLLGEAPDTSLPAGERLQALDLPRPAPGLPSDLLYRRPDLQSAEAGLVAAAADIEIARAAFLPSVTLSADGSTASAALSSLRDPAGFAFALGAGIVQTIFDNGATAAGVELNQAERVALLEEYRGAVLAALADVETALTNAAAQAEIEAARLEALQSARTAQNIAEAQYRAGSADFINLLQTQRSLIDAETDAILARQARLEAAIALYRALGGGYAPAVETGSAD